MTRPHRQKNQARALEKDEAPLAYSFFKDTAAMSAPISVAQMMNVITAVIVIGHLLYHTEDFIDNDHRADGAIDYPTTFTLLLMSLLCKLLVTYLPGVAVQFLTNLMASVNDEDSFAILKSMGVTDEFVIAQINKDCKQDITEHTGNVSSKFNLRFKLYSMALLTPMLFHSPWSTELDTDTDRFFTQELLFLLGSAAFPYIAQYGHFSQQKYSYPTILNTHKDAQGNLLATLNSLVNNQNLLTKSTTIDIQLVKHTKLLTYIKISPAKRGKTPSSQEIAYKLFLAQIIDSLDDACLIRKMDNNTTLYITFKPSTDIAQFNAGIEHLSAKIGTLYNKNWGVAAKHLFYFRHNSEEGLHALKNATIDYNRTDEVYTISLPLQTLPEHDAIQAALAKLYGAENIRLNSGMLDITIAEIHNALDCHRVLGAIKTCVEAARPRSVLASITDTISTVSTVLWNVGYPASRRGDKIKTRTATAALVAGSSIQADQESITWADGIERDPVTVQALAANRIPGSPADTYYIDVSPAHWEGAEGWIERIHSCDIEGIKLNTTREKIAYKLRDGNGPRPILLPVSRGGPDNRKILLRFAAVLSHAEVEALQKTGQVSKKISRNQTTAAQKVFDHIITHMDAFDPGSGSCKQKKH